MSKGLLAQIEAGVLGDEPLPSLLQKCIVLGGRAGSEKMRDWARQELNGYSAIPDIPPYRTLRAQVKITLTNLMGYQPTTDSFSTGQLPGKVREKLPAPLEEVPLGAGIGELDAMANSGKDEHLLVPYWADFLLPMLNKHVDQETTRVRDVYWALANPPLQGLLVQVRTNLAELVGELLALTPDEGEPSREAADAVTIFILTGDRNVINSLRQDAPGGTAVTVQGPETPVTVAGTGGTAIGTQTAEEGATVVGNQTASGEGSAVTGRDASPAAPAAKEGFFKRWRKRGIIIGVATVVSAAAAVLQLLGWTPW